MQTLTLIKCRECKWQGDVEELQIDKQFNLEVTAIPLCPKCDSFDLDWGDKMIKWRKPNLEYDEQTLELDRTCAVIEALREIAEQLERLNNHPTQHIEMQKIKPRIDFRMKRILKGERK